MPKERYCVVKKKNDNNFYIGKHKLEVNDYVKLLGIDCNTVIARVARTTIGCWDCDHPQLEFTVNLLGEECVIIPSLGQLQASFQSKETTIAKLTQELKKARKEAADATTKSYDDQVEANRLTSEAKQLEKRIEEAKND